MHRTALTILLAVSVALSLHLDPTDIFYGQYKNKAGLDVNLMPPIRNQNQPASCDASFAFAVTAAMSTLFNKNQDGVFPEIVLSPQVLLNCAPTTIPFSCAYGNNNINLPDVFDFVKNNGVSDESCNNYHASDAKDCSPLNQCKDCHNNEDIHTTPVCDPVSFRSYKLASYTAITSDKPDGNDKWADLTQKIQSALPNGPLVCRIKHSETLFNYRTSSIAPFTDDPKQPASYTTYVNLVGLGGFGDKLKQYFALQASFGENVGYFGIIFLTSDSASNPLGLLDSCYSIAVAPAPTFVANSYSSFRASLFADKGVKETRRSRAGWLNQGLRRGSLAGEYNVGLTLSADPPVPINWQNADGRNYLTYVKNQHIPTYCGSCWAQAAVSVLSDRLSIQRIKAGQVFPKFVLSAQAIINCKKGGSCFGGDSSLLFQYAQTWRVPTESCQTYQAVNPPDYTCPTNRVCSNRSAQTDYALPNYSGVRVTAWNRVRGIEQIKAALQNGPIVCDFMVTEEFVKYTKTPGDKLNIWTKDEEHLEINHAISIVGWGKQDDQEYLIGRNSWGREWGYDGHFYILAGSNVLGIESDCAYADVVFEQYDK